MNIQKKIIENIGPQMRGALVAGFFILVGALVSNMTKPATGRYVIIKNAYPHFDIFDTATAKIYYWRGVDGLTNIDDPIKNQIINVINRKLNIYLPKSK